MAYIYHNKKADDYWAFNNLARLSESTGINYENLKYWFVREKLLRVDNDDYVIVKVKLVKRKGSKK